MARRSRSQFSAIPNEIANRRLLDDIYLSSLASDVTDGRLFNPDPLAIRQGVLWSDGLLKVARPRRAVAPSLPSPTVLRFAVPERVGICARRAARREVLFAKRRTRRGAGSRKHRNYFSEVSCRR